MITLPAIYNVGFLLVLLLYMYSVLGIQIFSDIKANGPMDMNINFRNIGNGFLTMFRVATGENWHDLMHSLSRSNHVYYQCLESQTYQDYLLNNKQPQGCGTRASFLFFISFVVIVSLVFLNLFVAIILEGFEDT